MAFTRWNVEHTFRVAKTEIGFGHFEGRSYVALMRHMILCVIVMGFVAEHTDRLRKKNPEFTMEQVCRALNQRCRIWQRNRRKTTELKHTAEVVTYHQERNRAARKSRQKSPMQLLI